MISKLKSTVIACAAALVCACGMPHPTVDGGDSTPPNGDAADTVPVDVPTDVPATDGDGGPATCPSVSFVAPTPNATLGPEQSLGGSCANGFQYNVQVATNAANGTMLDLLVNGVVRKTATVSAPVVTFSGVPFDPHGPAMLAIRLHGTTVDCGQGETVVINCNTPQCSISSPIGPYLNAMQNVGPDPDHYAVNFVVQTDIEDNQPVTLQVTGQLPQTVHAMGGMATFNRVPLVPDGNYQAQATCTNAVGTQGVSAVRMFTVLSHPPTITVNSPAPNSVIAFNAPDVDMSVPGKQFNVCATTSAAGGSLAAEVMGSTPLSPAGSAIVSSATAMTCVEVTCPSGSASFNVTVIATDVAGGTSSTTLNGISCSSTAPSVRIISPGTSVMGMPSTYLNASGDADPSTPGFQTTVVACSDRTTGTATLTVNGATVGMPETLMPAGTACGAAGFAAEADFPNVTLAESTPRVNTPTDSIPGNPTLEVSVTDSIGETGTSPTVTVFVDTVPPSISLNVPTCGSSIQPDSTGNATVNFNVVDDTLPLTFTLQRGTDTPIVLTANAFSGPGVVQFTNVQLAQGDWDISATATDPAGNTGTMSPCTLVIGNPPSLSFTAPTSGQQFNATGDADPNTPGFQGATVTLMTNAPDGTVVSLAINSGTPVTANAMSGVVTFSNVTLPEGIDTLRATASVPGLGTGTATVNVTVDTIAPSTPTALSATVTNRRAGQMHLTWTSGGDTSPGTLATYQVRYSLAPITASNFASATPITYTGTPGPAGSQEAANAANLELGFAGSRTYYFAVRAVDGGGNISGTLATTMGEPLDLQVTKIQSLAGSAVGFTISAGYDVNGDSIPDLVVGTGNTPEVMIYYGSQTGGPSASNMTLIQGVTETTFGEAVVSLGDINGDGLGDIAVGAPEFGSTAPGKVYIYFGRNDTSANPFPRAPATLTIADADVVISAMGTEFVGTSNGAGIGNWLAHADFDGDGLNDLIISAPQANPNGLAGAGDVIVVRGRSSFPATLNFPTDADVLIRGNTASGGFGSYVWYGGNLLASGRPESFIVSAANGTNYPGIIYIYTGRSLAGGQITLAPSDAAFTRPGSVSGSLNFMAAFIGDVDGNGTGDLAVGEQLGNGGDYVLLSGPSGLTEAGMISPANTADNFGCANAGLDSTTNLHPSLLFGNPTAADLAVGSGLSNGTGDPGLWLFAGGRTNWMISATMNDALVTVPRNRASGAAPLVPIEWGGDLDADGYLDVVMGMWPEDSVVWVH